MKVLLVNGSPNKKGCTYTALTEVAKTLNEEGINTEIFWIGTKPLAGCIACEKCIETGRCSFDDRVNEFLDIAPDADGFIFGSPVHYAAASGAMTSFMDRAFYSALRGGKPYFYLQQQLFLQGEQEQQPLLTRSISISPFQRCLLFLHAIGIWFME